MRYTIMGQPPSKANTYRIVTISGHGSLAKTPALKAYEKAFYLQCGCRNQDITGFCELYVDVYFKSNQPDLDNSLKVILDCLQAAKVIRNDRQVVKIVAEKKVDKVNPRIEFEIREVGL